VDKAQYASKPIWRDKLRLIRKRWWRKSYAQHGEDMVLLAYFEGVKSGVYVDVGSFHPRRYSNTRALFEQGWHGVNIDISPRKKALFDFDRPNDHNICCAVADRPGELTAYVFGDGSALDTTDKGTADLWREQFGVSYQERRVPSRTLNAILDECAVGEIDYLNIDVEGAETAVLNGLDFARFRPRCISIEIHGGLDEASRSEPYRMLQAHGYDLHAWLRPTFIFTLGGEGGD